MAFKDWSTTANSNDTADGTVNWQEGQSPATINNSARAMMAALASWRDLINYGTVSAGTVGGSANAITLTCSPTVLARTAGRRYLFKYTSTGTTGGVTLVVDSLTSGAIQYLGAALVSGDIATGDWLLVADDGTNFQLLTPPRISTFKLVSGLTADASPDGTADYWLTYDGSASLPKKVLMNKMAATQAQAVTGTSTDVYLTPGTQKYNPLATKAWAMFDGSATGTNAPTTGSGITSITRTSAGLYVANLAVTFSATTAYSMNGWARSTVAGTGAHITADPLDAKTTTAMTFRCRRADTGGLLDSTEIYVEFKGTLA